MTLAEIDDALAKLRAAKLQRLTEGTRTKVSYASGSVEKSVASIEEITMEIARLELDRAKITGTSSGGGPIRIGFGGRV